MGELPGACSCVLGNLMTRNNRSRGGQWCSVCFLLFVHYLAQLVLPQIEPK